MSKINYEDYFVISLDYNQAINPSERDEREPVYVIEEFEKNEIDDYNFKSFESFIFSQKRPILIFRVFEYFEKNNSEINYHTKDTLHILEDGFDINQWELDSKINYDSKHTHCNNDKAKITLYFQYMAKVVFQSKKHFYLSAVIKKDTNLELIESNHIFLKKNALIIYQNIMEILDYKIQPSGKIVNFRDDDKNRVSKDKLKRYIVDDFVEGQSFINIEELWSLNQFKSSWDFSKFKSLNKNETS